MLKSAPNYNQWKALSAGKKYRVGIISTAWNNDIVSNLRNKCIETLKEYEIIPIMELSVPGSYELPVACEKICNAASVIIVLGCLIQGETSHMEVVASAVSNELQSVSTRNKIPIIFGILTCDNIQQAIDRINLGSSYAHSAIAMCTISHQIIISEKINASIKIIKNAIDSKKKMALSFNGGKDCTVVLELLSNVIPLESVDILFFDQGDEFKEIYEIIEKINIHYKIQIQRIQAIDGIKKSLSKYLQKHKLDSIFLGRRYGDPYVTGDTIAIEPSSIDWPTITLINPILNWDYHEIWYFLLSRNIPYCELYNIGYTSLGKKSKTCANKHLNGAPAWVLKNPELERSNRLDNIL
jgi:FAD synthetase